MKVKVLSLIACTVACHSVSAQVSATLNALTTFSPNNDGWLAPGEGGYTFLTTGTTERSIAYSPVTNHLYLVSRAGGNNVRILNPSTGADLGGLDTNAATITGGTFPVNAVSVGGDGAIYVANLAANTSATVNYKVYRWGNELAAPTVVLDTPLTAGIRIGDTLDAFGSGSSTVLAAGFGNTTSGYLLLDPTAGSFSSVPITGTNNGDLRSGITFVNDVNTVWGDPGSPGVRRTTWSGTIGGTITGSLSGTLTLADVIERPLDVAQINGVWVLATAEAGTASQTLNNEIRLWDVSNIVAGSGTTATLLASATLNNSFLTTGGNGSIAWGAISGGNATLYAMGVSNGIQAFNVTVVPEPSVSCGAALGLLGLAIRRRR